MDVNENMMRALSALPCEVCREPALAQTDTHVSWFKVMSYPMLDASNRARAVSHMMQVDVYSKRPVDDLAEAVLDALRTGGFKIASWGPDGYEDDTGYHHVPITVRWSERLEG